MVPDKVVETNAWCAIIPFGMTVGLWMVDHRGQMIQSHCGAQGGEEFCYELRSVIGQDKVGQTIGHN